MRSNKNIHFVLKNNTRYIHYTMGLVKALTITGLIYVIMYALRTKYIDTLSIEWQLKVLTWVPLILIFLYLLL